MKRSMNSTFLKKNQPQILWIATILFFIIVFVLRGYRLTSMPLWLDEIYNFQLAKGGVQNISLNSKIDPHPPIGYLLHALSTGFGAWQTNFGMRWLSFITGGVAVLMMFYLARQKIDGWAALAAGLLFAFSPMHIFYSQEARSTALVTLIAVIAIYWLTKITKWPDKRPFWIWYTITSLIGLYSSYSYVLVVMPQMVYLFFVLRQWRKTIVLAVVMAVCGIPFVYTFFQSVPAIAQQYSAAVSPPLFTVLQGLLGGEPVRYGVFWGHWVITAVLIIVFSFSLFTQKNKSSLFLFTTCYKSRCPCCSFGAY